MKDFSQVKTSASKSVNARKATLDDAKGIHTLITRYANKKGDFLLPRSLSSIYDNIRDFLVSTNGRGEVIGCGALHVTWENLGELKALAVSPRSQKKGIGTHLVKGLLKEARQMKVGRVFALTKKPNFFIKNGFHAVDKNTLPHKIWGECINCCHFPGCDEEAFQIEL
jgi:amino-acid N-acetyltransferase